MIGSEVIYHILEVFLNSEKYLWGKRLIPESLEWGFKSVRDRCHPGADRWEGGRLGTH